MARSRFRRGPHVRARLAGLVFRGLTLCLGLTAGAAAAALASGCASYRLANRVERPAGTRLFVPPAVDGSADGAMGLRVVSALRTRILERDPAALAHARGPDSTTVDLSLLPMQSRNVPAGENGRLVSGATQLTFRVRVVLRAPDGTARPLGTVRYQTDVVTSTVLEETQRAREQALGRAADRLAERILRRVEQGVRDAGAEPGAPPSTPDARGAAGTP